jgi:hypothetical protein
MLKHVSNLPTAKLFAQFDAKMQVTKQKEDTRDSENLL